MSSQHHNITPPERSRSPLSYVQGVNDAEDPTPRVRFSHDTGRPEVDMQKITEGLEKTSLQKQRLHNFDYQAYSLPVSRVHSREPPSSPSTVTSPTKSHATPPLTPASTYDPNGQTRKRSQEQRLQHGHTPKLSADPATMTPQTSPPRNSPPIQAPRTPSSDQATSPNPSRPPSSHSSGYHGKQPTFVVGPADSSESSPVSSGAQSPFVPPSRPFTPAGEEDDPYARHNRPVPSKKLEDIEARFKFSSKRHHGSTTSLGSALGGGKDDYKKGSHLSLSSLGKELRAQGEPSKKGSMDNLKRFFKPSKHHKKKRTQSPGGSVITSRSTSSAAPFGEDFGLSKKYGKFGKVLGSGAGGSVRLMKRSSDNVTFAVKEFRARHTYETEREYAKKVTAEFCIGSTLHHGNIVETLDIVHERGRWYEVMEYCPYDLFATVMTGKMTREEVACAFMQIVNGVTYLHSMGLAHRDLKLDNVVINQHGILKIIDFGSASVFRYPFENGIVEAHGIVGSDPYLSPEVCNDLKYDPQPADIWSLAIIFCCMSLRRFPWKAPRMSDNSFKLFSSEPDEASLAACKSPPEPAPGCTTIIPSSQIKGPGRLLRLLPRESRHIIGRMLELDPKKRATLAEMWDDDWIKTIKFCRQEDGHNIIRADNHEHVLETSTTAQQPDSSRGYSSTNNKK